MRVVASAVRVIAKDRPAEVVPPWPLRLPEQVTCERQNCDETDQHDQPARRREQEEREVRDARADRLVREALPRRREVASLQCLPGHLGIVGM